MEEKEENPPQEKLNQSQVFNLITGEELSWQAIIYDLIKTEQLDPWNINIGVLANKYIETIEQLEEADFFISSKVLLACSLLLRLKSDILLNKHIQSLDEALYGKQENSKYSLERIEIDEDELPLLIPRTPMSRHRKVTLKELMTSLNKAIDTENRRIKREIKTKQAEKSALVVLPKTSRIPLRTRVKEIFERIRQHLKKPEQIHMKYSELAPSKEEKIASLLPILHLSNKEKVYLKQSNHFEEIFMTLEMLEEEARILREELGEIAEEILESSESSETSESSKSEKQMPGTEGMKELAQLEKEIKEI